MYAAAQTVVRSFLVAGSRPGMLDFKGRAKFDAWEKKKGLAPDAAQKAYVELVSKLEARYGKS